MADGYYLRRDDLIRDLMRSDELTDAQKLSCVALLMIFMDNRSEITWVSQERIGAEIHKCSKTVSRGLTRCRDLGFLEIERRYNKTSIYGLGELYAAALPGRQRPMGGTAPSTRRGRQGPIKQPSTSNQQGAEERRRRDAGDWKKPEIRNWPKISDDEDGGDGGR